jgi:hypothetical protein
MRFFRRKLRRPEQEQQFRTWLWMIGHAGRRLRMKRSKLLAPRAMNNCKRKQLRPEADVKPDKRSGILRSYSGVASKDSRAGTPATFTLPSSSSPQAA